MSTLSDAYIKNNLLNTVSLKNSFVQDNVTSTAQTLEELGVISNTDKNLAGVYVDIETEPIRYRFDGQKATTTIGVLKTPSGTNSITIFFSRGEAKKLSLIATATDSVCQFHPVTFQ